MNNRNRESIGFAAFFTNYNKNSDNVELIYEDYIIEPSKFKKYTNEIKNRRNNLIYLTAIQIFSSIFGMIYIIFRRSFIYLFVNIITLVLALIGVHGALTINSITLLLHCVFTTSITAGFFIYQVFDLILANDTTYGDKRRINDNLILLLFSLPYVYDFITGIYNYIFLKKISEFNAEFNKEKELLNIENNKYSLEQILNFISGVNNKICVICMVNPRDSVLSPCGHVLGCEDCIKHIFQESSVFNTVKCPICRKNCERYVKLIIS